MNRRAFLTGILASAGVVAIGAPAVAEIVDPAIGAEAYYEQWQRAIIAVIQEHYENLMIYGRSAILHCDEYPFVRVIQPADMYANAVPERFRGLL